MNYRHNIRCLVVSMFVLICSIAVMAEDATFMTNRRQWEKLPTNTLLNKGFVFAEEKAMPDSAILCFNILANRVQTKQLEGEELEQCIGAICNLGNLYLNRYNDFYKAYTYLLQAEELAIKYHKDNLLAHVYINFANLFKFETELNPSKPHRDQVLSTYKKAFNIGIKQKEWEPIVPCFISMVEMAFVNQQLDSIADVTNTFSKLNIPDSILGFQYAQKLCKGIQLWRNYNREKAIVQFNNLDNTEDWLIEKNGMLKSAKVIKLIILYSAYHQLGQNVLALEQIKKSEQLAKYYEFPDGLMASYQNYIQYYTDIGDKTNADFYRLKRYELQDSISKASHVNDINTVRFLHELDKMNEEQKALTLKLQRDRQLLWMVSGFLLLALALLTLLFINRNRIKRKNRVLYENNLALLAADEQRRLLDEEQNRVNAEKYGTTRMDEQSTEELWQNITHVMMYSQEIFDESFNVARLAELIDAKPNYVSQAINQQEEWNFSSLLAHYRINEACRRMNDTANYSSYTIEGIAQSVGYSSRSYFVKLFKKQTGLTPSDYIKQAKSNNTNTI